MSKQNSQKLIEKAFTNNESVLDLNTGCVNTDQVLYISEKLKTNEYLTNINLKNNDFGDIGLLELLEALKRNSVVTRLNLENNSFSPEAVNNFIQGLRENYTVKELKIDIPVRKITTTDKLNSLDNPELIDKMIEHRNTIKNAKETLSDILNRNNGYINEKSNPAITGMGPVFAPNLGKGSESLYLNSQDFTVEELGLTNKHDDTDA